MTEVYELRDEHTLSAFINLKQQIHECKSEKMCLLAALG